MGVAWLRCASPAGLQGGAAFFHALREGDLVTFSCEDEAERTLWLQALYRATGQAHRPLPLPRPPAPPTGTFACSLFRFWALMWLTALAS